MKNVVFQWIKPSSIVRFIPQGCCLHMYIHNLSQIGFGLYLNAYFIKLNFKLLEDCLYIFARFYSFPMHLLNR